MPGSAYQRERFAHLNCSAVLQVAVDQGIDRFCVKPSISSPEGFMVAAYRPAPPEAHDTDIVSWLSCMFPITGTGPLPLSAVPVNASCFCCRMKVMENPFDWLMDQGPETFHR